MKRMPLKRLTPLRTRKPLQRRTEVSKVSARRQVELRAYSQLRKQFLAEHRRCEWPLSCPQPATVVHHRRGRFGARLLDQRYWAASCDHHNARAESHTGESLACGWLLRIEAA